MLLVLGLIVSGFDVLSVAFGVFLGLPVMLALAGGAAYVARRVGLRRSGIASAACFAIAAVPVLWAARETLHRATGPSLPSSIEARLPREYSLGNLCPGAETSP